MNPESDGGCPTHAAVPSRFVTGVLTMQRRDEIGGLPTSEFNRAKRQLEIKGARFKTAKTTPSRYRTRHSISWRNITTKTVSSFLVDTTPVFPGGRRPRPNLMRFLVSMTRGFFMTFAEPAKQ